MKRRRERIALIDVRRIGDGDPLRFEVFIREDGGETRHDVTMSIADFAHVAGPALPPERCIEAAFRFLLEREPKEAILRHFDFSVIASYFPEFAREFPRYL
jgi:hypothetical protein